MTACCQQVTMHLFWDSPAGSVFSSNDHSVVSAEREDGVHQFLQNCFANGMSSIDGERWGMEKWINVGSGSDCH